MARQFTAVYKKRGKWFLGWVEEIPGVNTQGKNLKEARENLKEALLLVIETNRLLSRGGGAGRGLIREQLKVAV